MEPDNHPRTEEERHLDALALKVSDALDGEPNVNVARVCAGIAVAAIAARFTGADRERNLEIIIRFMRATMDEMVRHLAH